MLDVLLITGLSSTWTCMLQRYKTISLNLLRCTVKSLGCILYRMLCHQDDFKQDNRAKVIPAGEVALTG
eukprot:17595-Amphidinium_carterae.1